MQRQTAGTKQQGAASIEFAFMFVLVFMIFYGMVGYFIPLLLSATYHELSSEALRQAISLKYSTLEHADIQRQANRVIEDSWLPNAWAQLCPGYEAYLKIHGDTWSACVRHDNPSSILTPISLFGLDLVPLPDEIRGEATVLLH
ncbi:MAG: TadE/TadG family type IV pilus assembly protein [Thiopseudomonas sp.]|jgi:hypothetical protein